jgi:hypothetical protein
MKKQYKTNGRDLVGPKLIEQNDGWPTISKDPKFWKKKLGQCRFDQNGMDLTNRLKSRFVS